MQQKTFKTNQTDFQFLEYAVCISFYNDSFAKDVTSSVLPPALGKE